MMVQEVEWRSQAEDYREYINTAVSSLNRKGSSHSQYLTDPKQILLDATVCDTVLPTDQESIILF